MNIKEKYILRFIVELQVEFIVVVRWLSSSVNQRLFHWWEELYAVRWSCCWHWNSFHRRGTSTSLFIALHELPSVQCSHVNAAVKLFVEI